MPPRLTIVLTTINLPHLLEGYAMNFEKYGHLDHVSCVIVGDRKTPHSAVHDLAAKLRQRKFDTTYLDLEAQEKYLDRFPRLKPLIPYNSDNRRNIGYFWAVEHGADILVAVDDDNFVRADDWYAGHAIVGSKIKAKTVSSAIGWYNPCDLMDMEPPRRLYARGFPYDKRWVPNELTYTTTEGRVALNGGLWLGDPDVDSLTRLTEPVRATGVREERIMLAPGTFAPINTQNTAFHRDLLPAFYFVPVGAPVSGVPVERYGDIWAGYFARKLIDQMNDRVTFGVPACDHARNVHILLKDLELEFWSIVLSDPLAELVAGWYVGDCKTYCEGYLALAKQLQAADWKHPRSAAEVKEFFGRMAAAMRVWVEACRQIGYK